MKIPAFIFIFALCASLRAQVSMPMVTQVDDDTNVIALIASWQHVTGAIGYRLNEWAYQSGLTNLFSTTNVTCTVTNLSETNADYGFCVATENASNVWSTNSLPVYWGAPNHHAYAMGYQTLNLLSPSLWNPPVIQTNIVDPAFQQLFFRAVAVNTTNWFAP